MHYVFGLSFRMRVRTCVRPGGDIPSACRRLYVKGPFTHTLRAAALCCVMRCRAMRETVVASRTCYATRYCAALVKHKRRSCQRSVRVNATIEIC